MLLQQKKEEEDEILKKIMDEYNIDDIKDTMDETGQITESIYFFIEETAKNLLMLLNLLV